LAPESGEIELKQNPLASAVNREDRRTINIKTATSLPAMQVFGDCFPQEPPQFCEWALSVDAVVWGTLESVRLAEFPAYLETIDGFEIVDACNGSVSPAMELVVDVERFYVTPARSGVLPDSVSVRLGAFHRETFAPSPRLNDEGELEWVGAQEDGIGQLIVGQTVGMAMHYLESDRVWSLAGEALFGLSRNGSDNGSDYVVGFQQFRGDCPFLPPVVEGVSETNFFNNITACDDTFREEAIARKTRIINVWGQGPQYSHLGRCIQLPPP
jgi:hypothetical protein